MGYIYDLKKLIFQVYGLNINTTALKFEITKIN